MARFFISVVSYRKGALHFFVLSKQILITLKKADNNLYFIRYSCSFSLIFSGYFFKTTLSGNLFFSIYKFLISLSFMLRIFPWVLIGCIVVLLFYSWNIQIIDAYAEYTSNSSYQNYIYINISMFKVI